MSLEKFLAKALNRKYLSRHIAMLILFRVSGVLLKLIYAKFRYKTVLKEGESLLITKRSKSAN